MVSLTEAQEENDFHYWSTVTQKCYTWNRYGPTRLYTQEANGFNGFGIPVSYQRYESHIITENEVNWHAANNCKVP